MISILSFSLYFSLQSQPHHSHVHLYMYWELHHLCQYYEEEATLYTNKISNKIIKELCYSFIS